jgi:LuxR family maltose regulon positive regulatory protein
MAAHVTRQVAARAGTPAGSAGVPILAAKITAPGMPGWAVPRPRISELIAQGRRSCPLTVVTAPAGAGKTMALASWAAAEAGAVAWVSLDEFDNQPGVFWAYVVAALRRSGVAVPAASPAGRGRDACHVFVLRLAAALAAQDPPVTVVLDDFHLLTGSAVRDGLGYVLRNAGAGLRLVVSARTDPLLPLHRYRLAGQLTEIRAGDLAFTVAEAGLLLGRHGQTLPADSLELLTRRTEGWAAGLRLAAMGMGAHPDPDRFVKEELVTEDSAVTGYLAHEVLNAQPPVVREVLLSTSILERVSAEAARELTGNEQAAAILPALARATGFVQPAGSGWYRYHTLVAEVLRLQLRRQHPGRIAFLHRRAARWYERNGQLTDAVRHAAQAGDWPLAASIVIDGLAIGEIIELRGGPSLAGEFAGMPHAQAWAEPAPHLICAAVALSGGRPEASTAALDAADGILARLPADQQAAGRLGAAMIRLAAARRTGDLIAAAAAAAGAQALISRVPGGKLAGHRQIQARVLSGRGAVELWSGHLDQAARTLESGLAAATASGAPDEQVDCLGQLALVEALRGRLGRAALSAAQMTAALPAGQRRPPVAHPAALVALAWVHLEHYELREARSRLKQADAALSVTPDKLIEAVAHLAAAYGSLATGRAAAAAQIIARTRSGWFIPAWLDHRLSLAESRAYAAAGDIPAALAAAERANRDTAPETAVTLAHAWAAAGDTQNATRALTPVLAAGSAAPGPVRLQAWLIDARLAYHRGDRARGRRSLASALRLAEPEQLRLPFVIERGWILPALRRDPVLAHAHQYLLAPTRRDNQLPAPPGVPDQALLLAAGPLSERQQEVLRHMSDMLSNAEIASEMHITVNTVKSHLTHIYRKLATTRRGEAVRRARQLELI